MIYPAVIPERQTLDLVLSGKSLARYGDGEFNLCDGWGAKAQAFDLRLRARLRGLLVDSGSCLVGIPNLHSPTPKHEFWQQQSARAVKFLSGRRQYASAFISRPDSAPWINTPEYWAALESLWVGQDVTLVRGGRHGLTKADLAGAGRVHEIICPSQNAWSDHEELLDLIGTPTRALLCLGPTATVLAADLCAKGVHAIDLGHIALFMRKYRRGEPMIRTEQDKVA